MRRLLATVLFNLRFYFLMVQSDRQMHEELFKRIKNHTDSEKLRRVKAYLN